MAEFYDVYLPKFAAGYRKRTGLEFDDRDPQFWEFDRSVGRRLFIPFELFLIWRKENRRKVA